MVQRCVRSMKFPVEMQNKVTFKCHVEQEYKADLAKLVERKALNLVVMGLSPMVGVD